MLTDTPQPSPTVAPPGSKATLRPSVYPRPSRPSMRPVTMPPPPARGWIALVGAEALAWYRLQKALLATLAGALGQVRAPGVAANAVVRRVLLSQIFFTGYQALPLVSVIALLLGATIIIQMNLIAPGVPADVLGKVLVALVVRELAPLGTEIVIGSRSGTAIATELGNMKVNAEVLALSSLGVEPLRYIVLPRIVGTVVSVMALMVYFAMVAIVGGYGVSVVLGLAPSFEPLRAGFAEALRPADLMLYLFKGIGLGTMVGWLPCHFGLEVSTSPTEVPQKASRAVVLSLLGCVAFNTAVTGVFYALLGPPLRY